MCRWLAYSGGSIHLDEVIFKPERSLIDQSLHSHLGATTTNGDGFGIGWYGKRDTPGVYKDILPAWNDGNLRTLAEHIESHLFVAHVRATTGTAVQRSNCHPFHYENWLFVHNGVIRDFDVFKRDLIIEIAPDLFPYIQGSTDSEIMFFLAISLGMMDDVKQGVSKMASLIEEIGNKYGIEFPLQMTLGISDGDSLFGFRYSSEKESRTLFHSDRIEAIKDLAPNVERFTEDTRALVSEPLGQIEEAWIPIPESSFVRINRGEVIIEDFKVG
jgi:predicted glutamine amidotransferase